MGVYSDVLAPPNFGFWFVVVVGAVLTLGPVIWQFFKEATTGGYALDADGNPKPSAKLKRDKRGAIAFGLFSALATLVLIHLFGDQRVFNWLYETPDRANAEGLGRLLVPFGPVFWVLSLVEIGVLFFAIRWKNGGYAILSLFITLLAFQFITGVPVFPAMVKHWQWTLGFGIGFIVVGVFWALWKWDRLARFHRERYDAVYAAWCRTKAIDPAAPVDLSLQQKADLDAYFLGHDHDEHGLIERMPKFRDHMSELAGWLMIWPMSMFESLLFDLLAEFFNHIITQLGKFLNAIMLRRWKGTEGHMLTDADRVQLENERKQAAAQAKLDDDRRRGDGN